MRSALIDHPQIEDKQRDLLLHTERIASLEQKLEKRIGDQNELLKIMLWNVKCWGYF